MEILVQRGIPTSKSIPGEMFVNGSHACFTLERPGVAILSGRYQVGLYPSPHFERLMPILEGVPGREDILIHWGNYPENSDGCILVGTTRDLSMDAIFETRDMFDALFPEIENAVNNEGCWITVKDPNTQAIFLESE